MGCLNSSSAPPPSADDEKKAASEDAPTSSIDAAKTDSPPTALKSSDGSDNGSNSSDEPPSVRAEQSINTTMDDLSSLDLDNPSVKSSKGKVMSALDNIDIEIDKLAAVDMVVNVFGTVGNSIDDFSSGNGWLQAKGAMDILSSVSQLAALTGPKGQIFAATVGGVSSLLSGIFSFYGAKSQEPPESPEQMMRRVVQEVVEKIVDEQAHEEMLEMANGEMAEMATLNKSLTEIGTYETISEHGQRLLADKDLLTGGVNFLDRLWTRISLHIHTDDENTARRMALLLYLYARLSLLCHMQWTLVLALWGRLDATELVSAMTGNIADRKTLDRERLGGILMTVNNTDKPTWLQMCLYLELSAPQRAMLVQFATIVVGMNLPNPSGNGLNPGSILDDPVVFEWNKEDGTACVLCVKDQSKNDGARVISRTAADAQNDNSRLWCQVRVTGNWLVSVNYNSGKTMSCERHDKNDGNPIVQRMYHNDQWGSDNDKWIHTAPKDDKWHYVTAMGEAHAVDVDVNNNLVQLFWRGDKTNQLFKLISTSSPRP